MPGERCLVIEPDRYSGMRANHLPQDDDVIIVHPELGRILQQFPSRRSQSCHDKLLAELQTVLSFRQQDSELLCSMWMGRVT